MNKRDRRRPKPHDHPDFDTMAKELAAQQITTADPNATQPLPDGIPSDADGFLAFLRGNTFNDAQLRYLRAALPIYENSPATNGNAKAVEILTEWKRVLSANPAPIEKSPFG